MFLPGFGRRRCATLVAGIVLAVAGTASVRAEQPSMRIDRIGSFEVGGKVVADQAGGTLSCDHGHVEYLIPHRPRAVSLLLWHSSSTAVWENRWDGGDGYVSIFLRRRYPIYLWDGPRVGRANWSCDPLAYVPPAGQDQKNFVAWRFGPRFGEWFPGVQFPTADPQAWDLATRERYAEFDDLANIELQAEAAAKAIDRIGPVVLVTNSAGGVRALLAATKATGSNVKALVAYENPGFVFPEGEGPSIKAGPYGPVHVPLAAFRKLAAIPMQFVWGDHTDSTPGWVAALDMNRAFVALLNKYGGHAEIVKLSDTGLHGNTHLAFADMNNVQVADRLSAFLKRNRLDRYSGERR